MCTPSCLAFIKDHLTESDIRGRSVLEVGALDVNGSARAIVTAFGPTSYLGVDMQDGPGVDEVCSAEGLIARFGADRYDVVFSTEMLEHVFDWRSVLHNLKGVLKPGGLLLVTTRSYGFGYHAYPYDFWRYQLDDMRVLFSDFEITHLVDDPLSPGVFLRARKPEPFVEADLAGHALYSMIIRRRGLSVSTGDITRFHARRHILQPFRAIERGVRQVRDRIKGR